MIKLPKGYLEDEIRDGYFVGSDMKSNWAARLEVVRVIDGICKKHSLKYFAAYGTLLGAARHNGYIPWDDDVDIFMLRDDYDSFINIAESELPTGYKLLDVHTDVTWKHALSRIVNETAIRTDDMFLLQFHGCPFAVGVDIFILDYLPERSDLREQKNDFYNLAYQMAKTVKDDSDDAASFDRVYNNGLSVLENKFGFKFDRDSDIMNQLFCLSDFIAAAYVNGSDSLLANYWNYGEFARMPAYHKLWFSETIDLGFEVINVDAPIGVEAVLNTCYGNNFMTPVVLEHEDDHHSFAKQKKILIQNGLQEHVDEKRRLIAQITCLGEGKLAKEDFKEPFPVDITESFPENKVILYVLNSASIIRYERKLYDKLERTIKIFEEAADKVKVILAEDITFLATLNAMYPDLFEKYMVLRQSVEDKGIGIVSDSLYYDFASVCDAYYGDGTTVVGDFMKAGKPVMLQNYTL